MATDLVEAAVYHKFIAKSDQENDQGNVKRFVPIELRKKESSYTVDNIKTIYHGKYQTSWRGVNLMKGPFDIIIMQQMIWREKPGTIIEIGAYTGASALWMSDIAKLGGISCHVYSMDIDLTLVDERARANDNVTFIEGDVMKIEDAFSGDMLKKLPHPWLISEDVHVNTVGCMEHFHKYMEKGDYFIIEDTNPDLPLKVGQGLFDEMGYETWGLNKHTEMEKFLANHQDSYAVDTDYTDFFGYNGSSNWNGYLRKIK